MPTPKKSEKKGGKEKQKKATPKTPSKKKPVAEKSQAETFYTEPEVYLKEVYAEYIRWTILTKAERKLEDAPATQTAFAKKWNIHIDTTTDWAKRKDFETRRSEAFRKKLAADVPEVMSDLRKRIKKYGQGMDVELYLAYAEGWDRKRVLKIEQPVQFGENDVRALIEKLPPDKQAKYYETIAKLLADARDADDDL
jgi:hypothetical protein